MSFPCLSPVFPSPLEGEGGPEPVEGPGEGADGPPGGAGDPMIASSLVAGFEVSISYGAKWSFRLPTNAIARLGERFQSPTELSGHSDTIAR